MNNSIDSNNVVSNDLINVNDMLNYLKNYIDFSKKLDLQILASNTLNFTVGQSAQYQPVNITSYRGNYFSDSLKIEDNIIKFDPMVYYGLVVITDYQIKVNSNTGANNRFNLYQKMLYYQNEDFNNPISYDASTKVNTFYIPGNNSLTHTFVQVLTPDYPICGYRPAVCIDVSTADLSQLRQSDIIVIGLLRNNR